MHLVKVKKELKVGYQETKNDAFQLLDNRHRHEPTPHTGRILEKTDPAISKIIK